MAVPGSLSRSLSAQSRVLSRVILSHAKPFPAPHPTAPSPRPPLTANVNLKLPIASFLNFLGHMYLPRRGMLSFGAFLAPPAIAVEAPPNSVVGSSLPICPNGTSCLLYCGAGNTYSRLVDRCAKIDHFFHLPVLPTTANPVRTRRNCHPPGRSLTVQLPPTAYYLPNAFVATGTTIQMPTEGRGKTGSSHYICGHRPQLGVAGGVHSPI